MYEVKADGVDPLEASFDAVAAEAAVGELRAEMAEFKARMDRAAVIAGRPALGGASAGAETGAIALTVPPGAPSSAGTRASATP